MNNADNYNKNLITEDKEIIAFMQEYLIDKSTQKFFGDNKSISHNDLSNSADVDIVYENMLSHFYEQCINSSKNFSHLKRYTHNYKIVEALYNSSICQYFINSAPESKNKKIIAFIYSALTHLNSKEVSLEVRSEGDIEKTVQLLCSYLNKADLFQNTTGEDFLINTVYKDDLLYRAYLINKDKNKDIVLKEKEFIERLWNSNNHKENYQAINLIRITKIKPKNFTPAGIIDKILFVPEISTKDLKHEGQIKLAQQIQNSTNTVLKEIFYQGLKICDSSPNDLKKIDIKKLLIIKNKISSINYRDPKIARTLVPEIAFNFWGHFFSSNLFSEQGVMIDKIKTQLYSSFLNSGVNYFLLTKNFENLPALDICSLLEKAITISKSINSLKKSQPDDFSENILAFHKISTMEKILNFIAQDPYKEALCAKVLKQYKNFLTDNIASIISINKLEINGQNSQPLDIKKIPLQEIINKIRNTYQGNPGAKKVCDNLDTLILLSEKLDLHYALVKPDSKLNAVNNDNKSLNKSLNVLNTTLSVPVKLAPRQKAKNYKI